MIEGYCVKCKARRPIADAVEELMKNGRKAVKGKCPVCGAVMFKILGGKISGAAPASGPSPAAAAVPAVPAPSSPVTPAVPDPAEQPPQPPKSGEHPDSDSPDTAPPEAPAPAPAPLLGPRADS